MRLFIPLTAAAFFSIGIGDIVSQGDEPPAQDDPVEAIVKRYGHPTKGLSGADLARSLLLEEGANARVDSLIKDLSGSDFSKREKAVADLIGISAPIDGALWKAREGADPGLTLLLDRTMETRQNLRALERTGYLFKAIADMPIKGLAVEVARTATAFDLTRDLEIVRSGISCVVATVDAGDKGGLESVIAGEPGKTHIVAVAGLAAIAIRAGEELPEANNGASKLGMAYALAGLGDPRAAGMLVDLLEEEPALIRGEAARLLDGCAGNREQFVGAYDPLPVRLEKIKWWRNWVANAGEKLKIEPVSPDGGWRGVTVACAGGKGGTRVVEVGMAGSEENSFSSGTGGMSGTPQAVHQGGNDGRTVILCSGGADSSSLHLFDRGGRWLWSAEGISGAGGFAVLPGGNYLLSDSQKPVLNEFDWLGAKAGERPISAVATGLQMLPGDRLLATVPSQKAIVEYDFAGVEIWKMENLEGVRFARRLANGHHLVVQEKGLTEFDTAGGAVWNVDAEKNGAWGEILSAARRPGGNTYLGTDQGLHEITPGLRVLRQITGGQINSLEAY